MQGLQDRRQIMILREEKRRLDATVASHEAVLTMADRARVEAETRLLLSAPEASDNRKLESTDKRQASSCSVLPVSFDTRDFQCSISDATCRYVSHCILYINTSVFKTF